MMSSWTYQNSETIGFTLTSQRSITPYVQIENFIPAKKHKKVAAAVQSASSRLSQCLDHSSESALIDRVETLLRMQGEDHTEWLSQAL